MCVVGVLGGELWLLICACGGGVGRGSDSDDGDGGSVVSLEVHDDTAGLDEALAGRW